MSELGDSLKKALPYPVKRAIGDTRDALERAWEWPEAAFHPLRRDTVARLAALKDKHRGERCFVIGNGPSLRQTDMTRLRGEYTIGVNRIYLMFPELGFKTSYYVSINYLVGQQCASDIQSLDVPRFIAWRSHKWLRPDPGLYLLYTTYTGPKFADDLRGRVYEGATVTYVALQTAFYLGFKEVILIGVDHSFVTQGKPNTTVTSQGDDPNHFSPGYFGAGFRWQLPDLETSERSYAMARSAYEAAGRRILDATVGGRLTVFPKIDYNRLF
jgi:hypothetical protein